MLISPLRYPGGKAKLFGFIAKVIQHNGLSGCHYCEPYAGGAGLALKLLSSGLVERASLNDVDVAIWAFWKSALEQNSDFCTLIENATLDIDEWRRQREVWLAKDTSDVLSLGFATFYLNRTNRSGIIEGAGPIGGYNQSGKWRLDARFDRKKQAAQVRALAPFRSRISLENLDALDFLSSHLSNSQSLTYLDPPYYVKGSRLYRNSYSHEDHIAVYNAISNAGNSKWIVSYDAVEPIIQIYKRWSPVFYSLNYSAGRKGSGQEVIYMSEQINMPQFDGFATLAA